MFQSEKPKRKRKPHLETEADIKRAYQDFYGRLLLILLTPAAILGAIFMLPVIIFNNMPDYSARYFAECSVSEADSIVRITSETTRINETTYSWRIQNGTWQTILLVKNDYRPAIANCNTVAFYGDGIIFYQGQDIAVLDANRQILRWQVSECDSVKTATVIDSGLNITCQSGLVLSINDTIVWDN
jgi:hypothetical protein